MGAESEEGEGAVEDGELVGARKVLTLFSSAGEVGPVGLVEAAGDGGGGAEAETEGQGVGGGEADTGTRETMRAPFGAFVSVAEGGAHGEGRGGLPACSEGDVPAGSIEVFQIVVASIVPARPFDGDPVRAEALRAFEAQAVFHVAWFVARPLLASTGKQAEFRVAREDPTGTRVQGERHAVEFLAAVFLPAQIGPGEPVGLRREGILVLGASPDDEAHPGGGSRFIIHPEGQSVKPDDVRARGGIDVAVWSEGESEMRVPTTAGADAVEKSLHVLDHRFRRIAGEDAFEMVPGEFIVPRMEEGAGEFETGSGEIGMSNENRVEARDGGWPVFALHGDQALQEVQLVEVALVRLDSFKQEFGIVEFAGVEGLTGRFEEGFVGNRRPRGLLSHCWDRQNRYEQEHRRQP